MSKPGIPLGEKNPSGTVTGAAPATTVAAVTAAMIIPRKKSEPIPIRPLAFSHPGRLELTAAHADEMDDSSSPPQQDDSLSVLGSSPPGAHPFRKKRGW